MKKTIEFRDSLPPTTEPIGHGKYLVHWNIEEKTDPQDESRVFYQYNEVIFDHQPTKTEVKKIKLL